jgi:membrane protease YdiL (CAAX protease family)
MLGTVLWGTGIAIVFVVLQSIVMVAYLNRGRTGLTDEQLRALVEMSQNNGVVLSLATLLTAMLCVPLILGIAKLKRGSRLGDYLAVRAIPLGTLGQWLGITALFIVASDTLTWALGQPVVPEFMKSAYASADPAWLIWLALVVGAPLFEEIFFRGFLFKGLEGSIKPIGAILVTAAVWSAIHIQYDLYGIGTLFVTGLLLGTARSRTNSIVAPLAMHALANVVACTEAAVLAHRVVA